ncbi:lytic transglycosylase domain-containing protein [Sporosarcina siberiensis]|uniref:Lytic transglycosylase domain-containing protein n=1 Tax=Sporosarcina siberiensis TaxID=1365606 RepID=A0ABW4SKH7_9BACL
MEVHTIRTLLDIKAMQSLGAVKSFSDENTASSSIFNSILGEVLGNNSVSQTSTTLIDKLTKPEGLLYSGNQPVFHPSSLSDILATTKPNAISNNTHSTHLNSDYTSIIKQAAEKFNLPEKLISAVIKTESNFKNSVVSRSGAEGLMQLMPGTAKFLGVKDSFDPVQNITGGAKYLRQMLNQFGGDTKLALAAYNAGPGNVKKYGGIPPFKETKDYVQKVLGHLNS